MIYYEVNVDLDNKIYKEYMIWLKTHVQCILILEGFVDAKIMRVSQQENTSKQTVVIIYKLVSEEALNNYLVNEAPGMRQSTINRFGDQLNITRRVLEVNNI